MPWTTRVDVVIPSRIPSASRTSPQALPAWASFPRKSPGGLCRQGLKGVQKRQAHPHPYPGALAKRMAPGFPRPQALSAPMPGKEAGASWCQAPGGLACNALTCRPFRPCLCPWAFSRPWPPPPHSDRPCPQGHSCRPGICRPRRGASCQRQSRSPPQGAGHQPQ